MKKTILYNNHVTLGARMVAFAGWMMPIQYKTGILEEHRMVRERLGIFDVSHMGEIEVKGPDTLQFLDHLVPSPVMRMQDGSAQYSFLCAEDGGVIDDIILYRRAHDRALICVNASNVSVDWEWMQSKARPFQVTLQNRSDDYALLAVQGPLARSLLIEKVFQDPTLAAIKRFHFLPFFWKGAELLVARTGYTGEDGFELFCPPALAPELWERIVDQGAWPVGLGARDSLRLEAGLPLYGHELDRDHSPVESDLSRFVDWDKVEYIGRERLLADRASGGKERLIAFVLQEPGIPRIHYPIGVGEAVVGEVRSGGFSPLLAQDGCGGIGLGFVEKDLARIGLDIWVEIRKKRVGATICEKFLLKK